MKEGKSAKFPEENFGDTVWGFNVTPVTKNEQKKHFSRLKFNLLSVS